MGRQFVDEVSGDWGGRAYVDLMKGLDAAEAKFPFIDKTRECALGASYGGYHGGLGADAYEPVQVHRDA